MTGEMICRPPRAAYEDELLWIVCDEALKTGQDWVRWMDFLVINLRKEVSGDCRFLFSLRIAVPSVLCCCLVLWTRKKNGLTHYAKSLRNTVSNTLLLVTNLACGSASDGIGWMKWVSVAFSNSCGVFLTHVRGSMFLLKTMFAFDFR